jgi:hypothetical protein
MSPHHLETEYDLTAKEILDALNKRFRAKVALEGAVAEVQLGKLIEAASQDGAVHHYQVHDVDGYPDYTIWTTAEDAPVYKIECKNVRDSTEAYREKGEIVAYKVETQKTRASQGDPSSRFYGADQFEILAVCLGKKTHDWKQFLFIWTKDLARHGKYGSKLAVMHKVPLPVGPIEAPWFDSLIKLLEEPEGE